MGMTLISQLKHLTLHLKLRRIMRNVTSNQKLTIMMVSLIDFVIFQLECHSMFQWVY